MKPPFAAALAAFTLAAGAAPALAQTTVPGTSEITVQVPHRTPDGPIPLLVVREAEAAEVAPAGPAEFACIWDHFPPAQRDAFLAANPTSLGGARLATLLRKQDADAAALACGVTAASFRAAGRPMAGYVLMLHAENWLPAHLSVTKAQLDQAWAGLDPALRARLAGAHQTNDRTAVLQAGARFLALLQVPSPTGDEELRATWAYLVGRAMLEKRA